MSQNETTWNGSTVTRCFFKVRDGETLSTVDGRVAMDRYAVVPLEEYNSLIRAVQDFKEKVT